MESKFYFPNFDLYSKRLGFYFNKHEKIGTLFGLFLTLTYVITSLILFIYQITRTIQRKELKVYDSTMHGQEMPSIDINSEQFYFAFGLEDPSTSSRFIDERIYIPKIVYVDKVKINDELVTVNQKTLEYEKCNVEKFGDNYQDLFIANELNNSYCLKDTDFNLTLAGGYKYERMTYIRIRIYPCVNTTENNNSCKPQETIDRYMSSGFFSIILKDFGLNPLNYSYPKLPTLQDLYTTIDKRIMRNYILNFRVTEINTDTGLLNNNIKKEKYLQYFKELQTFSFRDEKDYYAGKSVILVQFKLDDNIFIQKRSYTKISEIFSRIGGYMQLMNTVFLLLSSFVNRLNAGLKIINGIFKFNTKEKKMIIKFHPLYDSNIVLNSRKENTHLIFSSKNLKKESDFNNISSILNNSENKKININKNTVIRRNKISNIIPYENFKINSVNSIKSNFKKNGENIIYLNRENLNKNNFNSIEIEKKDSLYYKDFNEHISLNIFEYFFCCQKYSKRYNLIELYKMGIYYFRRKMDVVHVFTLLSITEKILAKNNCQHI